MTYVLCLMTYVLCLLGSRMPDAFVHGAFVHAIPDAFVVCRPGKLRRRSLPVGRLLRTVVSVDSNKHIASVYVLWLMPFSCLMLMSYVVCLMPQRRLPRTVVSVDSN